MTSSGYRRLEEAVAAGKLEITLIDAPPRTVGSALFRSLSQFYDASFYEAFHPNRGTFDEICGQIADKLDTIPESQHPKRILIKSLPRHFNEEDWPKMREICNHFIYAARDPHLQMYSLLERNANDLHYKKKGAEGLSTEEVWAYADKVGEWLQSGGERVGESNRGGSNVDQLKIQGDFARACWREMDAHISDTQKEVEQIGKHKSLSLVSGFLLRSDSKPIMKELLGRLHLPNDAGALNRACHEWSEESKDSVFVEALGASAYTEPVRGSAGFSLPLEPTPLLEKFPQTSFGKHIKDVALPIYTKFLSNPYLLGRDCLQDGMRHILDDESEASRKLVAANTVEVYAHVNAIDPQAREYAANADGVSSGFSNDIIKQAMLNKIKEQHHPYMSSFDVIDRSSANGQEQARSVG
jgi:hypothetical protein